MCNFPVLYFLRKLLKAEREREREREREYTSLEETLSILGLAVCEIKTIC
jgi:hypothetical protein